MHHFEIHENLERLCWDMRIQSKRTVEHYLQEVAANTVLNKLPSTCIQKIKDLNGVYGQILAASTAHLNYKLRQAYLEFPILRDKYTVIDNDEHDCD